MHSLVPLMLVPLFVWILVWAYLCSLSARVKRLTEAVDRMKDTQEES